jgi:hypothetical protein
MVVFVTKREYDELEECNCGGPILKFHNTSSNVFTAKCGYFKKIIEIDKETKRKVWITPKRPACNWRVSYPGERPVFKEINKVLIKSVAKQTKNVNEQLEEKLKLLFKFLHVSNHSSTLNEIDIVVKNNLVREPRLLIFNETLKLFVPETFQDYEKRIFSKKIIDLSYTKSLPKIETSFTFYDLPCLRRNENIAPTTPPPSISRKPCNFVEVTEEVEETDDSSEESEIESQVESDQEEDFERGDSDFESVFDDAVEETDNYEDTDSPDYYDD